jgi:hypothetical protein
VPKILVEANRFAAVLPTLLLVNSIGPNFIEGQKGLNTPALPPVHQSEIIQHNMVFLHPASGRVSKLLFSLSPT